MADHLDLVAGEAARALDDDRAHAIALDPLEHRGEAGPRVVGSGHGCIVEGVDNRKSVLTGEGFDRLPLA